MLALCYAAACSGPWDKLTEDGVLEGNILVIRLQGLL
jgi:hypothetical protein